MMKRHSAIGRKIPVCKSRPAFWKVLGRRSVYASPWVSVSLERIKLPDGRIIDDYHQVDFRDSVAIVARDRRNRAIMVRQYRHGYRRITVTVPAGEIAVGETPLQAARRELREETGYVSRSWRKLGDYVFNANYRCGVLHVFLALRARRIGPPLPEDLEYQETLLMSARELRMAICRQDIVSMGSVFALHLAELLGARRREEGRR